MRFERAKVELDELVRRADADRSLLQTLMLRANELATARNIEEAQAAFLVAPARPPMHASFPRTGLFVAFVFAVSAGASSGLVVYRAQSASRILRSGDIEQLAGVSCLGTVPEMKRVGPAFPIDDLAAHPHSRFAEGARIVAGRVAAALAASDNNTGPKVVLVTSALPAEGKTTMAIALAHAFRRDGQRCLIVDADLRASGLSHAFEMVDPSTGLQSVVGREAALADALRTDPRLGLAVLPAGATAAALRTRDIEVIRVEAAGRFDVIVIDGAPWTAVADPGSSRRPPTTLSLPRAGTAPRSGSSRRWLPP